MPKSSLIVLFALFLASCNSYHFVAPLPAVPQFEKAGEMQAQVALSTNHIEFQGSASPVDHFGFTFNSFRGFSGSKMNSYTVHFYQNPGKNKSIFLTGNFGYDKGAIESWELGPLIGTDYIEHTHSSKYQSLRLGVGVYYDRLNDERKQISFDLHYQLTQFSRLSSYYFDHYHGDRWKRTDQIGTPVFQVISPLITFTTEGSRKGLFYYRQTIGANIPIGRVPVVETYSQSGWDHPPYPFPYQSTTTILPTMSYLVFSGTVGMRLNVLSELINW